MLRNEFKYFLQQSSDNELYQAAREYLTRENSGDNRLAAKIDLLKKECEKRGRNIFEKALEDAGLNMPQPLNETDNTKPGNILFKRIDFMNSNELADLLNDYSGSVIDKVSRDYALNNILSYLKKKNNIFFCIARGDSMHGALIGDGAVMIVEKSAAVKNGDVVIARLNNDIFVKKIEFMNGAPILRSCNEKYPDIIVSDGDEMAVLGIVRLIIQKPL